MRLIRVFPRRTRATPTDDLAYIGLPDLFAEGDEVHISVAWTWDIPRAEQLAKEWKHVAPVKLGGPAFGQPSGGFVPGRYIRHGYVITSRGCPNRCWFCSVWKREGTPRELPIVDGWNILDDNLLACSESHVRAVFAMLARQPEPIDFSGGLEAGRLQPWHVDQLTRLRLGQLWFAYDTPDDYDPLVRAGAMLIEAGIGKTKTGQVSHKMRSYCIIGYPRDTMDAAERRLRQCYAAGFLPMAMLWRDKRGQAPYQWRRFQKSWARPASTNAILRGT